MAMTRAQALKIVDAIIADLNDRRGLKTEWRSIDSPIRAHIRFTWSAIVMRVSREKSDV